MCRTEANKLNEQKSAIGCSNCRHKKLTVRQFHYLWQIITSVALCNVHCKSFHFIMTPLNGFWAFFRKPTTTAAKQELHAMEMIRSSHTMQRYLNRFSGIYYMIKSMHVARKRPMRMKYWDNLFCEIRMEYKLVSGIV